MKRLLVIFVTIIISFSSYGEKPRARDLGIPFVGETGMLGLNMIFIFQKGTY